MGRALFGAGSSALLCLSRPATFTSSIFTPIERLPLVPGFTTNCFSNRLSPRCKDHNRDFSVRESEARISEEEELEDWVSSPSASPYQILGVDPAFCSPDRLKSAFRARVHASISKSLI